jgi:peptide/nickel transport system substrate-binding protein
MGMTRRGVLAAGAAAALAGPATSWQARAQKRGGELVFAQEGTIPTLDMHFSTAVSTRNSAMNILETLVTRDVANKPVAELAESWQVSPDGLTYTFKLRTGIKFHHGKVMTSADALASWQRYARISMYRRALDGVAEMAAPDPATFVVKLKKPEPVFLDTISAFGVPIAIYPAELCDAPGGKIDMIGTGPFRFGEFVPDSHVLLRRFDDYQPDARSPGNNGFAGRKQVFVDSVRIRFVSEGNSRVTGLETGEFHVVEDIPPKAAQRLKDNKAVRVMPLQHWWLHACFINQANGPTDKLPVRRAIQAALDMEEIMAISTDDAYDLTPGLLFPNDAYYTDAGKEKYNINDPALAKKYLQEAGYAGEELVLVTNSSYQSMYNAAVVMSEQLRGIGMKVRLDVFDWATAIARREDRTTWNLWFTGQGTGPATGPFNALLELLPPKPVGFVADPKLDAMFTEMVGLPTEAARKAAWAKWQAQVYDNVDFLKMGDFTKMQAVRASVRGFEPYRIPRFWNVSIEA